MKRAWGCWVRSMCATSVLCSPTRPLEYLLYSAFFSASGRSQRRQPYGNFNDGPRSRRNKNPYPDDDPEDPEYERPDSGKKVFDDDRKRGTDFDGLRSSKVKDQRKNPEPYNREPDYDGYRSKKQRPSPPVVNPSTDHLSGTNADDPVYYDDVFIDDVGEDYKDHNLVLLL